jgi:Holliday junction resolvase RusA-like endonuclease
VSHRQKLYIYNSDEPTTVQSVTLSFGIALPSLNQFAGKKWEKKNIQDKFKCRMKDVQQTVQKPTKATVRIYRYGLRLLDLDNLAGGAKPLLDALKGKLLWDDSPEFCKLLIFGKQVKKRKECRTEVIIEY